MDSNLLLLYLVIAGVVAAGFLVVKMVKDPTLALYLAVMTAPMTWSLGQGPFLRRLSVSEILGGLFILTWVLNAWVYRWKRPPLSSPMDPFVVGLIMTGGLSLLINFTAYPTLEQGLEEFAVVLYLGAFYLVFTRMVVSDADIRRVLTIWMIGAAVVVAIGLWDSLGYRLLRLPRIIGPTYEEEQFRVASTFKTTGQFGVYLLSTFFTALAFYFLPDHSRLKRAGLALLMVALIVASLFASRRSAFAGFVAGVAALLAIETGMMLAQIKVMKSLIRGLAIVVIGGILVTAFLSTDPDFREYFEARVSVLTPEGVQTRTFIPEQWEGVWKAFWENPLIGIGIGGYWRSHYSPTGHEMHSTYGQMLAETGLLGIAAYALCMFMLVKLTYDVWYRWKDPIWGIFCRIMFAAYFGFALSYFYNRHLRERTFWILVGVIVCIHRQAAARSMSKQLGQPEALSTPVAYDLHQAD